MRLDVGSLVGIGIGVAIGDWAGDVEGSRSGWRWEEVWLSDQGTRMRPEGEGRERPPTLPVLTLSRRDTLPTSSLEAV